MTYIYIGITLPSVFQPEFQKGWMEALKKDRDTGAS
jgi:hypothetical protein